MLLGVEAFECGKERFCGEPAQLRVKALFTQYHSALTYSKADSRRLCHSPSRHSIMTRFRTKRSNIQALKVKWTNEMHEKRTALGIFSSVLGFTELVEFFWIWQIGKIAFRE